MFIEVNSEVGIEDLLRGLLIQSGNDAAVALAEHVSGSVDAFVAEMNAAAKELGMQHSVFRNPHGLPARGHYTTARDLAVLAKAIIDEFPDFYSLYAEREFSYNGIAQNNRNALLWRDPSVDGMKTGYTESAGYCLVTSAHARRHAPDRRRAGRAERRAHATTARRSCSNTASPTSRRTSSIRRGKRSTTRACGAARSNTRA